MRLGSIDVPFVYHQYASIRRFTPPTYIPHAFGQAIQLEPAFPGVLFSYLLFLHLERFPGVCPVDSTSARV